MSINANDRSVRRISISDDAAYCILEALGSVNDPIRLLGGKADTDYSSIWQTEATNLDDVSGLSITFWGRGARRQGTLLDLLLDRMATFGEPKHSASPRVVARRLALLVDLFRHGCCIEPFDVDYAGYGPVAVGEVLVQASRAQMTADLAFFVRLGVLAKIGGPRRRGEPTLYKVA